MIRQMGTLIPFDAHPWPSIGGNCRERPTPGQSLYFVIELADLSTGNGHYPFSSNSLPTGQQDRSRWRGNRVGAQSDARAYACGSRASCDGYRCGSQCNPASGSGNPFGSRFTLASRTGEPAQSIPHVDVLTPVFDPVIAQPSATTGPLDSVAGRYSRAPGACHISITFRCEDSRSATAQRLTNLPVFLLRLRFLPLAIVWVSFW